MQSKKSPKNKSVICESIRNIFFSIKLYVQKLSNDATFWHIDQYKQTSLSKVMIIMTKFKSF